MSTAFVGATAVMLGVDCYTTAGLKEVSKDQLQLPSTGYDYESIVLHVEHRLHVAFPEIHRERYPVPRHADDAN